jgi:NADH dehydrogenase
MAAMILVTGSTGFVGRSLMDQLGRLGRPARGYAGRISNTLQLRAELEGAEAVIHLAGAESHNRDRLLRQVDVEGTRRLVAEARRAEVGRIVLLSRLNADPASRYPLLRAKGQAERIMAGGGIPYTVLRSATLFGRDDRFLNLVVSLAIWSWPFVFLPAGGRAAMQPLWVEDAARCLIACLERPELAGQTAEIGGEERMQYRDLVREALLAAGLSRRPLELSPKLLRPTSAALFGWQIRPPVTRYFIDRFSTPEVVALDSVHSQFGFRPARLSGQMAYLRRRWLRWYVARPG